MSIFASILRSVYKLSGAKKAFALPEDALRKEIEKQNRHRGVFTPTDSKAYYDTIAVNGFPCLIVRAHPKPSERAILYFFGGGMVIGPDKGDLPVMRKLCRETGCDVLRASVAELPFESEQFDLVTAFETVYFWPDLPQCFREVYRVLKPGGTILICNESNGDTDRDEKWTEIIGGMTIHKDTELKAYLEQAGFHDVQIHKKKSWLCVTARK